MSHPVCNVTLLPYPKTLNVTSINYGCQYKYMNHICNMNVSSTNIDVSFHSYKYRYQVANKLQITHQCL